MKLRLMATALLFHDGRVLMMKKQGSRLHTEPFWSGVGGHLEPEELNAPRQACLREIEEESGFREADIEGLRLRYILLRVKGDEIRQQFVYFGSARRADFISSEEGELFWVPAQEAAELPVSRTICFMLEHFYRHPDHPHVMVGTMAVAETLQPQIQWTELRDPLVF